MNLEKVSSSPRFAPSGEAQALTARRLFSRPAARLRLKRFPV